MKKKSKNTKLNKKKNAVTAEEENRELEQTKQIPISFATICDPRDFDYLEEQKEVLPRGSEHIIVVCNPQTEYKWTLYNEMNHFYGEFLADKTIKEQLKNLLNVDSASSGVLISLGKTKTDGVITRVYEHNYYKDDKINTFSFGLARNLAMKMAKRDWVAMIDADERVYMEERHIELFKNLAPDIGGVVGNIVNYFPPAENPRKGNEYGKITGTPNLRFIRNHSGLFFINKVHEMASPAIERNNMKLITTDIIIKHIGFAKDGSAMLDKYYRNLSGMLFDLRDRIKNINGEWITDYQLENYIYATLRDIRRMKKEKEIQLKRNSKYSRINDGDRYQEQC